MAVFFSCFSESELISMLFTAELPLQMWSYACTMHFACSQTPPSLPSLAVQLSAPSLVPRPETATGNKAKPDPAFTKGVVQAESQSPPPGYPFGFRGWKGGCGD